MSEIPPPSVPPATPPGGGTYTPPPPPPPGGGASGSSDRTLMLVLSYLWLLSIVPLLIKKDDSEVQWHAKNGLVWAIAITVIDILFSVVGHFFPFVGCLVSFVPCLLGIGYLVVCIIAIMKALKGERLRLPVLTEMSEKM
jgi:uncharacterized membrane protein